MSMPVRTRMVFSLVAIGALVGLGPASLAASSRAAAASGTPVAVAPANVRVSSGDDATNGEPALAVNPKDSRNLLGGAMRRGDVPPGIATFASFDGGTTWTDNGTLPDPPGLTGGFDVSVTFDANGVGFVSAAIDASGRGGVYVWSTVDGGRRFSAPVAIFATRDPNVFIDHPSLASSASTDPHDNALYATWGVSSAAAAQAVPVGAIVFSRSVDGGRTWSAPTPVSDPKDVGTAIGAVVTAGPKGAVHILYTAIDLAAVTAATTGVPAALKVASSSDRGASFTVAPALTSQPMRLAGLSAMTTDPRDGTVYVATAAYLAGAAHAAVQVWTSTDGAQTWSGPTSASDDLSSDQSDRFQPQLVAAADGSVFVSYFRLTSGRVDLFLARSTNRGASFDGGQRITDQSFDPALGVVDGPAGGGPVTTAWIGDYQGLAAAPDAIHPFWNDTRTGRLEIFTAAVPLAPEHATRVTTSKNEWSIRRTV